MSYRHLRTTALCDRDGRPLSVALRGNWEPYKRVRISKTFAQRAEDNFQPGADNLV